MAQENDQLEFKNVFWKKWWLLNNAQQPFPGIFETKNEKNQQLQILNTNTKNIYETKNEKN